MSYEVGIGTAIVAYIEPHAGQAAEFNRWYERDHYYAATMAGPGVFAGGRWVATRGLKARRPNGGTLFGDPARGSYLATYWVLDGMQADWDAWVVEQMRALGDEGGRMFPGRDHVHTAVYRCSREWRAPGAPSAAVALDHCFAGVVELAFDAGAAAWEGWVESLIGPSLPVAVALVEERTILSSAAPGPHTLVLGFVEGDVDAAWRELVEPRLDGAPVRFASAFLRTVPGTDRYTDEL